MLNDIKQISEKSKEAAICESLKYAKKIQNSIFPDELLNSSIKDYFIFNQPTQGVGGDFFWHYNKDISLGTIKDEVEIFIVGDCTGHGVPGALMTFLVNGFLNNIIKEQHIIEPSQILYKLDEMVIQSLNDNSSAELIFDGLDISVLIYNKQSNHLYFSGAKNGIIILNNNELSNYKASSCFVGYAYGINKKFTTEKIEVKEGSVIYMYSDGYKDQFGGENDKKIGVKLFKKHLTENALINNFNEQKSIFKSNLDNWKSTKKQTDDVLLLGFKIPENKYPFASNLDLPFELFHFEGANCLQAVFKGKHNFKQFKSDCGEIHDFISVNNTSNILIDTKHQVFGSKETYQWLVSEYFPSLSALNINKLAFVIPNDFFIKNSLRKMKKEIGAMMPFSLSFFLKKEEAMIWLQSKK